MRPKDAASLLKVPVETVYEWIRNGTLPSYRLRDKHRLNRVELLEWATARQMNVSPELFREDDEQREGLLLTRALERGGVVYDLACTDKRSALRAICDALTLPEPINRNELFDVLVAREALCSTGIGNGIAIPHPRAPIVLGMADPIVSLFFPEAPIEYGAVDGKPVKTLFVLFSTTVHVHLTMLSHLVFALQKIEFRRLLESRAPQSQILSAIGEIERNMGAHTAKAGATSR